MTKKEEGSKLEEIFGKNIGEMSKEELYKLGVNIADNLLSSKIFSSFFDALTSQIKSVTIDFGGFEVLFRPKSQFLSSLIEIPSFVPELKSKKQKVKKGDKNAKNWRSKKHSKRSRKNAV